MKYFYVYKTGDGVRHEASMTAESREDVFSSLRERGIKAIKVVAADGSKANGEIRGVRKRIVVAALVLTAVLVGGGVFWATRSGGEKQRNGGTEIAQPLPRQEIRGDRQRVEAAHDAFRLKAERFLARFAEPGRPFAAPEGEWPTKADFEAAIKAPIRFGEDEFTEQIDLKRIVVGIKREMSTYLRSGGYVSGYVKDLIRRQEMEIEQREKASKRLNELLALAVRARDRSGLGDSKDLKNAYDFWIKANAQLQAMGIYALPLPDMLVGHHATLDVTD